ncbi:MAG: hypothetical protein M9894_34825 [Planctomycetes bacterium]|nr:hypothetical protein [Planctomycetota bacterium]
MADGEAGGGGAPAFDAAREALAQGDARAAFAALRPALEHPAPFDAEALGVFAEVAFQLAGPELAGKVQEAVDRPDDVRALYDLGYELLEHDLDRVGAAVLERAHALAPTDPGVLSELVAALERAGLHRAAVSRIAAAADGVREGSFLLRYLLGWNTVMSGDLEGLRALAPSLGPASDDERFMAARLEGVLARGVAVRATGGLDDRDLRGWHFAVNGGVLLHASPHGLDEPMRGRYAFVQDSAALCREGIERARLALEAGGLDVPRVLLLPERGSQALGLAAARLLGLPAVPWEEGHDGPGLVVAYDLAALDDDLYRAVRPHRPGQVLWGHASRWTDDQPIAADLVTFLYQFNTPPWGEQVTLDPQGRARPAEPDLTPAEGLAERIVEAPLDPDALHDAEVLRRFAAACAGVVAPEHRGGAWRADGVRRKQWAGGPVPSARFT